MSFLEEFDAALERFTVGMKAERTSMTTRSLRLVELRGQIVTLEDQVKRLEGHRDVIGKELAEARVEAAGIVSEAKKGIDEQNAAGLAALKEAKIERERAKQVRERVEEELRVVRAETEKWVKRNEELKAALNKAASLVV